MHGVYIYSDHEKGVNADGIDIVSSKNVTISDSIIETADDAIVLKAIARDGQPARPVENVTVTNCVLTSSSTALMIGTETQADIHHVLFNNCVIRNSNKGFGINVQDGGVVSDVIVSNLTVDTSRGTGTGGQAPTCKLVLKKRTPASRLGAIPTSSWPTSMAQGPGHQQPSSAHAERPYREHPFLELDVTMLPEDAVDKRASHALLFEHASGVQLRDLSVHGPTKGQSRSGRVPGAAERHGFRDRRIQRSTGTLASETARFCSTARGGVRSATRWPARAAGLGPRQRRSTNDITISGSRVPAGATVVTYGSADLKRMSG